MALGRAGAEVVLSDLAHIVDLTTHNLGLNCLDPARVQVMPCASHTHILRCCSVFRI